MAIKVVNSSPGTIKVSVSETSTVTVSSPDNSVISVEPGITPAERSKLASIDAGAAADQVLTGGTNISLSESSGDYTINLDNSIDLSGTLDVSGDATLDSNLTVAGDITVSDSGGAIFQTESASDNINVGAQTVKFNKSTGGSIQATSSSADISLKSLSGDASIKGRNVTIQIGDSTSTRAFKVFDENASFNQNRFVVDGKGTTTLYQAIQGSTEKLFEVKAATSSPFALEHVQIGPDSGGYQLPAADGSANTFLQTDGSGAVTFVAPTISDLSDSSNVTTLDGTQTITGNKTFSGTTALSGTTFLTGATAAAAGLTVSGGTLSANSGLSVSGTTQLGTTTVSQLSVNSINFTPVSAIISTIQGVGNDGADDLQVLSDGNVIFKLDQDNDETDQKLIVTNSADTEKFSVNEDGTVTVYGKIVSASNGDIDIEPNGTGDVLLGNFKFDADQSVGSGQDNFVLTYDNSTGKISLEAATGSGSGSSTLLGLSDTPSSFTASKFVKVNSAGDAVEFVDDSNLNALVTLLKGGSSTTLTSVGDGTSTDKGVLNLGASSASLKFNTTGITIDEASPGDIEFIVATDSSGSTAFTALHIDGSATANVAETIIKSGNTLKLEDSSGDKVWLRVPNVSSDTTVLLPATDGTIALTSQVPSNVTDLSDVSSAGSGSIITSSERTKLTNIETAADVTDATNVAAAGALMASSAQLTGNLDTQANEINTTTSNGNVKVAANGTGVLEVRGNNGGGSDDNPGAIKLNCAENTHGIIIKSPPHAQGASYTLTLPPDVEASDANKVLQTDASGNLDWVALPSDTNTQNTTTLSFEDSTDDIILRNTTGGAGSGTQDIKFVAGSNITLTHTDANNITIAATTGTGSSTFLGLSDTPGSFTASKFLKVNSAGNAIELVDSTSTAASTEAQFVTQSTAVDAAGEAEGTIVKFGDDSTTAGKVYTFSSGTWVEVDANDEAKTKGLLGMALGANSTTNGMLVHGVGYLSHNPGSAGDILYISHSATGQISSTQPSDSADFVRVVGHCLASNKVFFSPSQDYIDLA